MTSERIFLHLKAALLGAVLTLMSVMLGAAFGAEPTTAGLGAGPAETATATGTAYALGALMFVALAALVLVGGWTDPRGGGE